MRMYGKSVMVEDQQKALEFYTNTLGFTVKHNIPMGEHSWITLLSPEEPDGVELLLEPNEYPAAKALQQSLMEDGIPWTAFSVDDIEAEGSQLTIVAMPVRQRFDLDPQLLRLMSSRGINFLDMRYTIELSKDNYKDRMHLNEQGSARFSELMIDRLLKTVKPYDPQSETD